MSERSCTNLSPCKSCGLPVRWAVSHDGKWRPIDAQPDNRPTGGDLVLTVSHGQLVFEPWEKKHGVYRNRWTCHLTTCPARHRRTA